MIKLGIFGDSFADGVSGWGEDGFRDVGPSWIEHIESTGKYSVECWAMGGSTLFYSKKFFDQYYHKYDKIIFVVTFPDARIWIPCRDESNPQRFINPGWLIERHKFISRQPNRHDDFEKKFIEAGSQYFSVIEDREYLKIVHDLMVKDIVKKVPNTILLPVCSESIIGYAYSTLGEITIKEHNHFRVNSYLWKPDNYDARKCHMSEENNLILSKKILEMLDGAPVKIDINDYVLPTKQYSHYFRPNPNVYSL